MGIGHRCPINRNESLGPIIGEAPVQNQVFPQNTVSSARTRFTELAEKRWRESSFLESITELSRSLIPQSEGQPSAREPWILRLSTLLALYKAELP